MKREGLPSGEMGRSAAAIIAACRNEELLPGGLMQRWSAMTSGIRDAEGSEGTGLYRRAPRRKDCDRSRREAPRLGVHMPYAACHRAPRRRTLSLVVMSPSSESVLIDAARHLRRWSALQLARESGPHGHDPGSAQWSPP